ncbi:MAG TPA: hypothetical protein VFP91_14300, partial [Vicinamibacterales bacterium]|nr:hypothetical protein [Vicinamibacterales bacterium]
MRTNLVVYAIFVGTLSSAISACGSSPSSPSTFTNNSAAVAITIRQSTVEPITTPGIGWLYRLLYEVHETRGRTGATLTLAHWALSNGFATNDNFSGSGVIQVPHVAAGGTITVESHLSVLTTAIPA